MFVSGYKDGEMLQVGNATMGAKGGGGTARQGKGQRRMCAAQTGRVSDRILVRLI